jgi:hypothetical protein
VKTLVFDNEPLEEQEAPMGRSTPGWRVDGATLVLKRDDSLDAYDALTALGGYSGRC